MLAYFLEGDVQKAGCEQVISDLENVKTLVEQARAYLDECWQTLANRGETDTSVISFWQRFDARSASTLVLLTQLQDQYIVSDPCKDIDQPLVSGHWAFPYHVVNGLNLRMKTIGLVGMLAKFHQTLSEIRAEISATLTQHTVMKAQVELAALWFRLTYVIVALRTARDSGVSSLEVSEF